VNRFATIPERDRTDFFIRYEERTRVDPAITEKDFWVCWLLGLIFSTPELGENAVFKGGTSLSKVFGVINRFSEDVDLGLSPESLGYPESEIDEAPTKNHQGSRQPRGAQQVADFRPGFTGIPKAVSGMTQKIEYSCHCNQLILCAL